MIEQIAQAIKAKDHETLALHGVTPVPYDKDGKTLYKYKFSDPGLAFCVKRFCEQQAEYFDGIQHVRKIALNSLYGATINEGSRYYRDSYGASTTAGGREITQHMIRTIGQELTGQPVNIHVERRLKPDGKQETLYTTDCPNVLYSDTDSVVKTTIVNTSEFGELSIEDLFLRTDEKIVDPSSKTERGFFTFPVSSLNFDYKRGLHFSEVDHVYRHHVQKKGFKIQVAGRSVTVTDDHSLMVERDGKLIEIKPSDLQTDDKFIHLTGSEYRTSPASAVEEVFIDDFVYDIVMKDTTAPYFFGDGILVHNSCYFATGADDPEDAVLIADHIAEHVNESFVGFVQDYFLVQPEFNSLIKVAREVVADRAVFIAKKKYLMHLYDKEGKRVDELKVQGAENKKSSTPAPIREFLNTITNMILRDNCTKDEVFKYVHESRDSLFTDFDDLIEMGVAQSANKIEFYTEQLENGLRPNIPGHVRAAIQYNECLDMFKDYVNPRIYGGDKIKVYHLEENQFRFKTLALPSDSDSFPPWFKEYFRLNKQVMEEKLIEKKLERLFNALDWPLPTRAEIVANSLLEF